MSLLISVSMVGTLGPSQKNKKNDSKVGMESDLGFRDCCCGNWDCNLANGEDLL